MTAQPAVPPTLPRYGEASLADLATSLLASLGAGGPNPLDLSPASRICLLVVDGLGWELLRAHQAAAPFLSELAATARPLSAGFPATTVTSLSSLGGGPVPPRARPPRAPAVGRLPRHYGDQPELPGHGPATGPARDARLPGCAARAAQAAQRAAVGSQGGSGGLAAGVDNLRAGSQGRHRRVPCRAGRFPRHGAVRRRHARRGLPGGRQPWRARRSVGCSAEGVRPRPGHDLLRQARCDRP